MYYYFASTEGFEYPFARIWNSQMDLGLIEEWMFTPEVTTLTTPSKMILQAEIDFPLTMLPLRRLLLGEHRVSIVKLVIYSWKPGNVMENTY